MYWSKENKQILRENYPPESREEKQELVDSIEGRDWEAIKKRAMREGLTSDFENHPYQKKVLEENTERNKVEVDISQRAIGYICGVIDGDGYVSVGKLVGLETKDEEFADKFRDKLDGAGFNPSKSMKRGKHKIQCYSTQFVEWYEKNIKSFRVSSLSEEQRKAYLEGLYESDGTIHKSGGVMICSCSNENKEKIARFLTEEGFEASTQHSGVWISTRDREKFFDRINPVIKNEEYYGDGR